MSSAARIFAILDMFDVDRSCWTAEQIVDATGFSRPTTFRYLRELCQSGLLARFAGGYVLGAKAVKLDYVIRHSDPLLQLFDPVLDRLRENAESDVIMAQFLGGDFFATVHKESRNTTVNWSRGRTMPLTRGAGGLAVLAAMPAARRKALIAQFELEEAAVDRLNSELKQVTRQGYAISFGALDDENVGIAVPIALQGAPPAALILVIRRERFETSDLSMLVRFLRDAEAELYSVYGLVSAVPSNGKTGIPSLKPVRAAPPGQASLRPGEDPVPKALDQFRPLQNEEWPIEANGNSGDFPLGMNVYRVMAHHPALLAAWRGFRNHVVSDNTLDPESLEMVILRTGARRRSRYEWTQHVVRGRKAGLNDARILSAALSPGLALTVADGILLRSVDALVDDNRLSPGLVRDLLDGFGKKAILDLIATVGMYSLLAYLLESFQTPIDEDVATELDRTPLGI